ncbi:PAAR domain-containing protein [Pseudomonas sp. NFIX28]|uniref:PAAR domain-containing protein n=1 Tax=Pseudomonas sp. NFIX28 TaxID=1566235 RepID=UPI000897B1CA|nr:PAAR domain-containing protein [Pseudomonas sp. NFIX28]SDY62293.1 Zn-binding Pro-Ala-Ala-Arg (PAAR) domain-containing protein, incolved in TypeVI secretion [Pseudomonas sp. NFIX28]
MSGKPAARVSDPTACPLPGHATNPIAAGSGDVFFDGLAAARQGDASACGGAMSGGLATTVLINGKPAATVDSVGTHGNIVIGGSGTVIIGNSHSPAGFVPPIPLDIFGFNIRVQLMDPVSGEPLKNMAYIATLEDGSQIHGVTDEAGLSPLLGTKASVQNIEIAAKPNWLVRGE